MKASSVLFARIKETENNIHVQHKILYTFMIFFCFRFYYFLHAALLSNTNTHTHTHTHTHTNTHSTIIQYKQTNRQTGVEQTTPIPRQQQTSLGENCLVVRSERRCFKTCNPSFKGIARWSTFACVPSQPRPQLHLHPQLPNVSLRPILRWTSPNC